MSAGATGSSKASNDWPLATRQVIPLGIEAVCTTLTKLKEIVDEHVGVHDRSQGVVAGRYRVVVEFYLARVWVVCEEQELLGSGQVFFCSFHSAPSLK